MVLQRLLDQLMELDAGLAEGEFVVVEADLDQGHPKTRTDQKNVVVEGENRSCLFSSVSPPLKVAVFRAR